jgi:hypothetical protein
MRRNVDLFPTWTLTLLLGIIVVLVVFLKTDFRGKSKRADKSGFERFLEEWEKENEAFLRTFSEVHRDLMKRIDRLEERVETLDAIARSKENGPMQELSEVERVRNSRSQLRDRYKDIFDMADDGMSVADIARSTGRGNGEVQLILGLAERGTGHD